MRLINDLIKEDYDMSIVHEFDVNKIPHAINELVNSLDNMYKYGNLKYKCKKCINKEYYTLSIPIITGNINRIKTLKKHFGWEEKDDNEVEIMIPLREKGYSNFFQKELKTEYDNSDVIWEVHKKTNKELKIDGSRYYLEREINCDVSGDVIFNFNDKKLKYYREIIEEDTNSSDAKKIILKEMLDECNKLHHSPQNVSMMFSTGGLNNFKQGIANDRFDVFAFEMKKYYLGNKLYILENGNSRKMSFGNRKKLKRALDTYGEGEVGFNKFFSYFYHVEKDSRFITELLKSGEKQINDCESIYRYLCLAFEYWIIISTFYCSKCEVQKYYLNMDNANPPGIIYILYDNFVSRWERRTVN